MKKYYTRRLLGLILLINIKCKKTPLKQYNERRNSKKTSKIKNINITQEIKNRYKSIKTCIDPFSKTNYKEETITELKNNIKILTNEEQLDILNKITKINKLIKEIKNKKIVPNIDTNQQGYILLNSKGKIQQIKNQEEILKKIKVRKLPKTGKDYKKQLSKISKYIESIDEVNKKINKLYTNGNMKIYAKTIYDFYNKNASKKQIEEDINQLNIGLNFKDIISRNSDSNSFLNLTIKRDSLINEIIKNKMKIYSTNKDPFDIDKRKLLLVKQDTKNNSNEYNINNLMARILNINKLQKNNNLLETIIYLNKNKKIELYALTVNSIIYNKDEGLDINDLCEKITSNKSTKENKKQIFENYNKKNLKGNILITNNKETLFNSQKTRKCIENILLSQEPKKEYKLLKKIFEALISLIEELYDGTLKKHFGNINQKWKKEGYTKKQIIKDILMQKNNDGQNIGDILADIIENNKKNKIKTKMLMNLADFLQEKGLNIDKKS